MAKMMHNDAIWHEKYNRWQVNVTINGKRKSFYSSTPGRAGKHEAEEKAAKWFDVGANTDGKVSEIWALYLDHIKATTGTANYGKVESIGRNYVIPLLGKKKLSKLRPLDWQSVINSQAERGLSHKSLCIIRSYCHSFVIWAVKNEYVATWADLDIPRNAKRGERATASPEELRRIFSCDTVVKRGKTRPEWYVHAYRMIVINGLRRGECAGIREEDIENGVLSIRRSINKFGEITEGKTINAQRRIGLSAISITIIEQQRRMKREAGIVSPWLFCDPDGNPINTNSLQLEWSRHYAQQLGIKCTLHELRHTFISAVKADLPLPLLKALVGHATDTDSIGIYGHEYGDDLQRSAQIIDRVFDNLIGQ